MLPPLLANAGIPTIMLGVPALLLLFVPVVLIEAVWYRLTLSVQWRQALNGSLRANAWSTFVGIPIAGVAWTISAIPGMMLVYGTQWITPNEYSFVRRMLTLVAFLFGSGIAVNLHEVYLWGATLVFLLPAYLVSYIGEARKLQSSWPHLDRRRVYRQCWLAHLFSYGLLYAITIWRYLDAVDREGLNSLIPSWSAWWF